MPEAPPSDHDFGPSGYLPERAARRARKIVLREQLGLGWVLVSLAAAVVLLGAGGAFLMLRSGPPAPPYEPVADLDGVAPGSAALTVVGDGEVVVVRAGSTVRVFEAPAQEVAYCNASGRLEGRDGTVWDLGGRRLGGPGASLTPLPALVHRGTVYADTGSPRSPPAAAAGDAAAVCG